MIEVRSFDSLGAFQTDWLNAKHHFSFGHYHDPKRMGWGALRVWNDDEIQPKTGFPPHPHAEMEIITYVRDGAITHEDSLGNKGRTVAGDVQVMSAGSGIRHAEYNMEDELTRIFQIWIMPDERGGKPYWNAREFPKGERSGELVVLASGRDGDSDALPIRADARVLGGTLEAGQSTTYALEAGRHAYLALAKGKVEVNGSEVSGRDGAAIRDVDTITITAVEPSEVVMVDSK
ncbi:pirin family protein [Maricaulaceae bacterium EIL42A08]|nr:pirin family protein [Maricaulaceae bacterium EIL42A08]